MKHKEKFIAKGVGAGLVSAPKEKGITLIALVITIIVLLILAGVTIAMVVGDNGILTRAKESKTQTEIGDEKEKISVAFSGLKIGKEADNDISPVSAVDLEAELTKKDDVEVTGTDDLTVKYTKSGRSYLVKQDGTITEIKGDGGTGGEGLTADEITVENYGAYVNYNVDIDNDINDNNKEEWRVFYANSDRIFLIAADCVDNNSSALSTALKQCSGLHQYNTHQYYTTWDGNDGKITYECEEDECTFPSLFEFTNYKPGDHFGTTNSKCVSELLCTTKWESFLDGTDGNGFGECAIGGPTLEMWINSWNKHDDTIYTELFFGTSTNGYTVGEDPNASTNYCSLKYCDGYNDTLYFTTHDKASKKAFYWLCSPSASNSTDYIMDVNYNGDIYSNPYGSTIGLRPVVCLKPGVKLVDSGEKASDGKTIYNLEF